MLILKENIQALVSKYEESLAAEGVKISISKKYFETEVDEQTTSYSYSGEGLMGAISRFFDRKREKKYNHIRNRYHCIVLTVSPIDKQGVPKTLCKEYSFVLRKAERAHIGQEPQYVQHKEAKILSKIERRMLKIQKAAEKHRTEVVCKDTLLDMLRYLAPKYGYKQKILGKERSTWELAMILFFGALAVILVALIGTLGTLT